MKKALKYLLYGLIALVVGAILGIGSAFIAIEGSIASLSVNNGPWFTNLAIGSEQASPHLRAAIALHGLLALSQSETIYFTALNDSAGNPLDGNCTYVVKGKAPDARWWSITVYGADDFLIPNDLNRYSYNMNNITFDSNGVFTIYVSKNQQPGAWLPLGNETKFSLSLRMYNPSQSVRDHPDKIELPTITKEGCK